MTPTEREFQTMATSLSEEVQRLTSIIEANALRRSAEESRLEELAKDQNLRFEQFVALQVAGEKAKDEHRRFIARYVIAPIVAAILGTGGVAGMQLFAKVDEVKDEATEAATSAVTAAEAPEMPEAVKVRLELQDQKFERIVNVILDNQVEQVVARDYIIKKIELVNPKAKTLLEPPEVTAGREVANKIRENQDKPAYDRADPLKGLELPEEE